MFMSPNLLRGKSPTRCDDLFSIATILIKLCKQKLPWEHFSTALTEEVLFLISESMLKNDAVNIDYLKRIPIEISVFYLTAVNLDRDERPNYKLFRSLLKKLL